MDQQGMYQQQPPYQQPPMQYAQHPTASAPVVYAETYQQNATTTFVSTTFGHQPAVVTCNNCRQAVTTTTTKDIGMGNILGAVVCCILGCQCGCCLIPFCVDQLSDTVHHCPSCRAVVGKATMM